MSCSGNLKKRKRKNRRIRKKIKCAEKKMKEKDKRKKKYREKSSRKIDELQKIISFVTKKQEETREKNIQY